ncbi:hypothetical protein B0H14DRAFT_3677535 [Mycena olivaceomarginata]|nr:hypothetical protein B0H14DRAFT_3677535 [Mycena olivaceomarginata]
MSMLVVKKGAPLSVRQVTAIGNIDGSASHPQFMLPPLQSHSGGFMFPPPPSQPHVSGSLSNPTLNQPAYPPQMYGYSSAHSQYRANRQLWGSRAYQSVLEDFITVKSLHEMADFLSFTQHVQYYKTAGMVYLSDLQGTLERLTDPQIMTSPSIGDGIDLFGDGNVPAAFAAFPAEHACNKFCAWFKLPQPDANNAAA